MLFTRVASCVCLKLFMFSSTAVPFIVTVSWELALCLISKARECFKVATGIVSDFQLSTMLQPNGCVWL